jgi:hypothetical protein
MRTRPADGARVIRFRQFSVRTLAAVTTSKVCGWQRATVGGRCDTCRMFRRRHGRDKEPREIEARLGAGIGQGVRPEGLALRFRGLSDAPK